MERTLLLTGFEPFLDVAVNPSGLVARAMDGERLGPHGPRLRGVELPVSFARAPNVTPRSSPNGPCTRLKPAAIRKLPFAN